MIPTRTPAVSGTFYPSLPARLRSDVRAYLGGEDATRRAPAVLAPHAGYQFSGATAGAVFGKVAVPATVVVLAPNHTGRRTSAEGGSVLLSRRYRTPLGDVEPDEGLGNAIMDRAADLVQEDLVAHAEEHGVEVILPFLQVRNPRARLVPIVLGWADWERSERLAHALHAAVAARDDVLVVASSDMNHYEPADVGEAKDTAALERVQALDGEGLLRVTTERKISMCGRTPAAVACEYARLRGGTRGEVVAYSHSGLVTGDDQRVVGYAGALLGGA
jgi:AmmeMemoRadiSam system protein B